MKGWTINYNPLYKTFINFWRLNDYNFLNSMPIFKRYQLHLMFIYYTQNNFTWLFHISKNVSNFLSQVKVYSRLISGAFENQLLFQDCITSSCIFWVERPIIICGFTTLRTWGVHVLVNDLNGQMVKPRTGVRRPEATLQ